MRFVFLIFAAAVLSLLLLGCTGSPQGGQQPPAASAQAPPMQGSGNTATATSTTGVSVTGNGTGAGTTGVVAQPPAQPPAQNNTTAPSATPAPKGKFTCSLTLDPTQIEQRGSTEISYSVWSDSNIKFTYNCGSEEDTIATGGLTSGSKLCEFDKAGTVSVQIKADGYVCAEKNLTVITRAAGEVQRCWIDTQTIVRRLNPDYYYSATVLYEGFSENDTLTWTCDRTTARSQLGGGPLGGVSASKEIYCDFSQVPFSNYIEISIGKSLCGSISTR
ncbi:Uncharacterised protein [uncultured archaeon]|nr:Uncharacterised protein [uncultured archaeon]